MKIGLALLITYQLGWSHTNPEAKYKPVLTPGPDKAALQALFGSEAEKYLGIALSEIKSGNQYDSEYWVKIDGSKSSEIKVGENNKIIFCPIYLDVVQNSLEKSKKVHITFSTVKTKIKILGELASRILGVATSGKVIEKVKNKDEISKTEKPIIVSKQFLSQSSYNTHLKAITDCKEKYSNPITKKIWEKTENQLKELAGSETNNSPKEIKGIQ